MPGFIIVNPTKNLMNVCKNVSYRKKIVTKAICATTAVSKITKWQIADGKDHVEENNHTSLCKPFFSSNKGFQFTTIQSPSFIQWHFPLSYSLTISVMFMFFYNHNACKWWWKFLLLVLYVVIVAFHFSIFYKRCSLIFWYLLFLSSNLHQCNQYYCWDIHIFSKVNMLVVRRKWTNFWR